MKDTSWIIPTVLSILILGGIVAFVMKGGVGPVNTQTNNTSATSSTSLKPESVQKLAACIKASGAKFYGAFWCPHCNDQKDMFGDAKKELPYIECSTPDGRGENPVCAAAKITGYPTWVFADGTSQPGALSFEELAQRTGCTIE
jgi:thiol-disulfide isomerase/thioredoxin